MDSDKQTIYHPPAEQQQQNEANNGWTNGSVTTFTGTFSRGGAFKSKGFVDPSYYSSSVLVPISKNSQLNLTISSTETVYEKQKSYTVYVIKVRSDNNQWEIVRRYKHFRVFSIQIQNEVPSLASFEFPSKKLIGNMNPNFIKNRKEQLQKFLTSITLSQPAKLSRNLKVFLDPNFSPSLRTIINPSKEGYLYLLRPGKYLGTKKQWVKVYFVAVNSNLFFFKNREQPYMEARGVIQLCHCITKTITKQDRTCIEINENNSDQNNQSKYLFLSKGKSFSHKIHHSDISNNINNFNNTNNIDNNNNNNQQTNDNDIYYISSDSDSILEQWILTIEKETFKYLKDKQSPSQKIKLGNNKLLNRKSVKKQYKDDEVIDSQSNNNNTTEKEIQLLESELAKTTCKDLNIDSKLIDLDSNSSKNSTPSSSFLISSNQQLDQSPSSSNTTSNNTTTTTATPNRKQTILDSNISSNLNLLHSEEILYFSQSIIRVHQNAGTIGSITITNYRFYFASTIDSTNATLSIPLTMISKIVKCTGFTLDKVKYYAFELYCKDFNKVRFMHLPGSSQQKANSRLLEILESLIFKKYNQLFCFYNEEILGGDGWQIYNPIKEFERLGIPNEEWRISHFNKDYNYSPTYPSVIVVPKRISDQELINETSFRSKGRIPALVWKSSTSNATISRCSQPVVGISKKRSLDDEKMIESIRLANPASEKVYIMDARPQLNAVANQVMGLGYEDTNNDTYNNCVLKFLDIENIHKMRSCQKKLFKAIMNDQQHQQQEVDNTNNSNNSDEVNKYNLEDAKRDWLENIRAITYAAVDIVDLIQFFKSSIVVHCSDGWDRTSQLTSLAQILLDPYYRSIIGFQVLIEKEWLSFGHKFESRIGHGSKNYKSEEYSPIFLQFIDCVWQIMEQNPTSFEFNGIYLMEILHHLYSCRFGTFLFDCEEKRVSANLSTKTTSIWSYINQNVQPYLNKNYNAQTSINEPPIRVDTSELSLWSQYYSNLN
ncbi:hypothetical protein DICPUDRAFT_158764 [Dictyostelium purpureum]|uniref:phosphatidylinositol-3,5-bisphosphate 3-phosphatase n=1 Tax=Dictyostelium purpureum TaxID=5786 RepID=F1A2F1_DICPU|nr:uncharacterized protein DICPUDRAFT_158764 [Dictyostelium purpureum]EGC29628.1 hypothetical protein DICPUDRAFT_158764 [Dictyostelium purpureum]|eukprot:XP_003293846.1 hypothetical protein DICPUDRAFT_158764 [Dictyostelium purpureum]